MPPALRVQPDQSPALSHRDRDVEALFFGTSSRVPPSGPTSSHKGDRDRVQLFSSQGVGGYQLSLLTGGTGMLRRSPGASPPRGPGQSCFSHRRVRGSQLSLLTGGTGSFLRGRPGQDHCLSVLLGRGLSLRSPEGLRDAGSSPHPHRGLLQAVVQGSHGAVR